MNSHNPDTEGDPQATIENGLSSLKPDSYFSSEPLVVVRQFDDLDVFAEALKPLNITATQLTPGQFLGTVNHAGFGGLKFTYVNNNQSFRAIGPKSPQNLTFALVIEADKTKVIAHGSLIQKWHLFGFDRAREVNMVIGKNAQIIIADLNLSLFQSLANRMGYDDLDSRFLRQNFLHYYPATLRNLRAYYLQIVQTLNTRPSLLKQPPMRSLIIEDFLPLLIEKLGNSSPKNKQKIKYLPCYPIVKKAEEIARSHLDRPLTLQQLCDALETSSSTLAYGFREIFGVSPMAYLKVQRLNGVRRSLKNADPEAITVMQIANQWGFWSLGHFSRDYKAMFGELPSETLNPTLSTKGRSRQHLYREWES